METILPKFSIIIATHDRHQLLNRAIQSIQQQTYQHYQIVIISDSNCLNTYKIASKMTQEGDLFVQRYGNAGPAASRNIGMNLITGDYFIFLDDDDTFQPNFLENIVNQLQESSSKEPIYYTNFQVVHEKLDDDCIIETEMIDVGGYDPSTVYVKNFIPNNCLVFPKRLAVDITFDKHIAYEDWDFILSACAYAPLQHLSIFGPRIHKNNNEESVQRGKSNETGLIDCYIKVYGKHPPINHSIAIQRQELFSSINLDINEFVDNSPLP